MLHLLACKLRFMPGLYAMLPCFATSPALPSLARRSKLLEPLLTLPYSQGVRETVDVLLRMKTSAGFQKLSDLRNMAAADFQSIVNSAKVNHKAAISALFHTGDIGGID